jgi:predicted TIM-barrel fold metal-dependent hydrolase
VARTAIISVDGHVKLSRAEARHYVSKRYLATCDEWAESLNARGLPDAGNLHPDLEVDTQWDSDRRLKDLESQGVIGEVLFPNGMPFQAFSLEDVGKTADPELQREGQLAYNRWLADFCAQAPGRRAGCAVINFSDIDQAVKDIHWAKENGLMSILMPAPEPGQAFYDPALDPIWAACQDLELPISQHGGTGTPMAGPPGYAAIMTLAWEHSFYSGRSLWQMILGGVFDRFPDLKVAWIETGTFWIASTLRNFDRRLRATDDWTDFARFKQRKRDFKHYFTEYWATNCFAGASPFTLGDNEFVSADTEFENPEDFQIKSNQMMFGVDYPHFETIFPTTEDYVAGLVAKPGVTEQDAQNVLFESAAALYGFDRAALQDDIDTIGFELSELGAPKVPLR